MLNFAYSTINWGDSCDLAQCFDEIRETGWPAVELFAHTLDWLGTPQRCNTLLGGLQAGLVGAGRPRAHPPSDEDMRDLANLCDDLAAHGKACGVTVAYHPHSRCTVQYEHETDHLLALTQHLMLCLDVSHVALAGEDPLAQLRKYRNRLGYVHLKDWGKGDFVELGRGDGTAPIDFAACLHELDTQQFNGWVVVEQSTSEVSAKHSAQINAAYLKKLGWVI